MYKIVNQNANSTEILLYSLIFGGWTANQIIEQLKMSESENITLRINSDGGEVFDAIAIYNYLKDKNVNVIIDGMCASAASVVAMCGKSITMKKGSMMMIHNPLTIAVGEAEELREQADILDKITASIAGIYAAKTGKSQDEIMTLMKSETWMSDSDALAAGFVDTIELPDLEPEPEPESEPAATASYDDGIKAERERLRELDELSAPGRESIINRAKYETFQSARDIAIELLKSTKVQNVKHDDVDLTSFPTESRVSDVIDSMARAINEWRN